MRKFTPEQACSSSITKVKNQSIKFGGGTHLYYFAMMNLVVFLVHRGLHRKERAARLKMQTAMYRPSL